MNDMLDSVVSETASNYGWESQYYGKGGYKKDGYEVYFFSNDGFELTIRDPTTMERKSIIEVRGDDVSIPSPQYIATLQHVLADAENIVSSRVKETNEDS